MRPDQITMLNELAEKLADVFLMEGDPSNWSGAGKLPVDMEREERGNRKWDKANAMATGGVLRYVLDITSGGKKNDSKDEDTQAERESDLDRQILEAQKRAADAMKRVMGKPVGNR